MTARLTEEDRGRLLTLLREAIGSPVEFAKPPRRLAGAVFSAVFGFQLASAPDDWRGQLVLRQIPAIHVEQSQLEAAIQNALNDQHFPAPRVLLVHDAPDLAGAPFIVMQRLEGRPVLAGSRPDLFARDFPKVLRNWPRIVVDTLRQLHDVDAQQVMRTMTGEGIDPALSSTTRHLSFIRTQLSPFAAAGLGDALDWLAAHEPPTTQRPVIVHGDLWPANVLRSRGRLSGLVDWNRAGIGHPALDVAFAAEAFALMPSPFPPPPPITQILRFAGRSMSERLGSATRVDPDAVRFFRTLRCLLELADVAAALQMSAPTAVPAWVRAGQHLAARAQQLTEVPVQLPRDLADPRHRN